MIRHPCISVLTPHPTRSQYCRADPARPPCRTDRAPWSARCRSSAGSLVRPTPQFDPANVSGPLILARLLYRSSCSCPTSLSGRFPTSFGRGGKRPEFPRCFRT
ncbi:MAG: hypothetical protein ACK55Z_16470, partial [bacterium]